MVIKLRKIKVCALRFMLSLSSVLHRTNLELLYVVGLRWKAIVFVLSFFCCPLSPFFNSPLSSFSPSLPSSLSLFLPLSLAPYILIFTQSSLPISLFSIFYAYLSPSLSLRLFYFHPFFFFLSLFLSVSLSLTPSLLLFPSLCYKQAEK